jgi:hypothetical protein
MGRAIWPHGSIVRQSRNAWRVNRTPRREFNKAARAVTEGNKSEPLGNGGEGAATTAAPESAATTSAALRTSCTLKET